MNIILRLLPGFFGVVFAYFVALYLLKLDVVARFFFASIVVFLFSLLLNKYNIWVMIKTGEISGRCDLSPKKIGHVLNAIGSVFMGYFLVEKSYLIGGIGVICLMYAIVMLTKTNKKRGYRAKVSNKIDRRIKKYIEKESKKDPLIALKIGCVEIENKIIEMLGVMSYFRPEVLMCAVGAVAGYACHSAIREELIETGKVEESKIFVRVEGTDGNVYYYGDAPNKFLIKDPFSILATVNSAMEELGVKLPPNIDAELEYVASTIGGESFGRLKVSNANVDELMSIDLVRLLWKRLIPEFDKYCTNPVERVVLMSKIVSNVIHKNKELVQPEVAAQIILQSAIAASKIGPEWLD